MADHPKNPRKQIVRANSDDPKVEVGGLIRRTVEGHERQLKLRQRSRDFRKKVSNPERSSSANSFKKAVEQKRRQIEKARTLGIRNPQEMTFAQLKQALSKTKRKPKKQGRK